MKNRYLALLIWTLVSLAGVAPDVFAQDYPPVPVTISRSQVSMNGKTYYAHIVLERQTIFGITQAYGVTEEDLYAANPMLATEGLKAGTVIYVPTVSGQKNAAEKATVKKETKPAEKTETKPVEKKETKPVEKKETKPAEKKEKPVVVDTTPAPTPNEDGFLEHTVKWFEDIYDVAKAYNVTAEQIMAANNLKSSRISKRQTLLIPATDKAKQSLEAKVAALSRSGAAKTAQPEEAPVVAAVPVETPVVEEPEPVVVPAFPVTEEPKPEATDVSDDAEDGLLDWLTGKGTADIALILPFNASGKASESNMDF